MTEIYSIKIERRTADCVQKKSNMKVLMEELKKKSTLFLCDCLDDENHTLIIDLCKTCNFPKRYMSLATYAITLELAKRGINSLTGKKTN